MAILTLIAGAPAKAALAVGDSAPDFSIPGAQNGRAVTVVLADLLESGPVVVYFFPSAFTNTAGCRDFAEYHEDFRAAGASVVGISRDAVDTLVRFSAEEISGKFPVASADERLVNAFDVNDGAMFNTRTTYVIAPSGEIVFVHDNEDHLDHVRKALAFVRGMRK